MAVELDTVEQTDEMQKQVLRVAMEMRNEKEVDLQYLLDKYVKIRQSILKDPTRVLHFPKDYFSSGLYIQKK